MPQQTQTKGAQGAAWTSAYVSDLPDASFAYVEGDVRKLPYKDKTGKVDLPHVRNALSRLNQTQGVSDDDKGKIRVKLQNALKSAKAAEADSNSFHLTQTYALLADDQKDLSELPDRVMLLRSGEFDPPKYWPFAITADDIQEMKDNFDLGIGLPADGRTGMPIDYGHKSGENAAGWIKQLEVEKTTDTDGNVVAALYGKEIQWSTSGKAAVQGLEYKCLSADFWPRDWPNQWSSSEQAGLTAHNVVRGVALTNVPMFDNNDPISASDANTTTPNAAANAASGGEGDSERNGVEFVFVSDKKSSKESIMADMNLDELRAKKAEDLKPAEALFVGSHASELSGAELKKFGLEAAAETEEEKKAREDKEAKAAADAIAAQAASSAGGGTGAITDPAVKAAIEAKDKQIESLVASVEALQGSAKQNDHDKIQKEVEAHASRGAIKPDQIETLVTAIEAADEKTREALRSSLSALSSNPLLGKVYGNSKTEGTAAMDISAEVEKKAKELMADAVKRGDKLNIIQATKQALADDPELNARSIQASQQTNGSSFDPYAGAWGGNAAGLTGVNPEALKG